MLLRELEKLRCEAQDNGNINWDRDFTYFCTFIKDTLCSKDIYTKEEKDKIAIIMNYIKSCGEYAEQWNHGLISENDMDVDRIAYTNDNLYDIIADAIGYLQFKAARPTPYEKNNTIKR